MNNFINIVIPMAGRGRRFIDEGYSLPKPLIDVDGKPMIQRVIENLKPNCPHKFIFICQKDHCDNYNLEKLFASLLDKDSFECIQIDSVTQGAACTVLTSTAFINNDDSLIIANSDQIIDININEFINFSSHTEIDGAIMTFPANEQKWSYAQINKDGYVKKVAEKIVISPHATVGVYFYARGSDFVKFANEMIRKNIRVNNEFYVCPIFNEFILDNKKITIFEIEKTKMHGLGTPEDLKSYLSSI